MAQAISEIWTSGTLHPTQTAGAESAVREKDLPNRRSNSIFSRAGATSSADASGMPPIVQFVLHAIAWCRGKMAGMASSASPLRLVSHLALGGKKSLALVEADGVRFLVGGGADSVTVIVPVMQPASGVQENAADICNRGADETRKP